MLWVWLDRDRQGWRGVSRLLKYQKYSITYVFLKKM